MTVICAYTDGTDTWIGSDTVGCCSSGAMLEVGPKWSGAYGWKLGHCGSNRVGNIIAAEAEFLFADAFDALLLPSRLASRLEDCGIKPVYEDGAVPNWRQGGILARRGAIFDVDGELGIAPVGCGMVWGRGCGGYHAEAAAYGYHRANPAVDPALLIRVAIEAAAVFDHRIRGCWVEKMS